MTRSASGTDSGYLTHIGRVHGLAGRELGSRIDECLDRLGGRELAPVPMRTMSKGMSQKVAVAQALLPGRGLLVLDEAWTGLDVQAKAALDEAVAGRAAAGGLVVFVDHDPARLAGLDAERWRLEDAAAVPAAGGETATAQTQDATVIELTGLAAAGTAAASQYPGVLSVTREGERVVIRAERAAADLVLRRVLTTTDDVHVIRVDAEQRRGVAD